MSEDTERGGCKGDYLLIYLESLYSTWTEVSLRYNTMSDCLCHHQLCYREVSRSPHASQT